MSRRCAAIPAIRFGRVNLGNLLAEEQDFAGARLQYEAALAADPDFAEAHQGIARVLSELGEAAAAAPHWQKGFAGRALVTRPHRGAGPAVPVLLLVSARGGNIPTQQILDDRVFAVSALYAEFFDPAERLPAHALIFNAIGDADLCREALDARRGDCEAQHGAGNQSAGARAPDRTRGQCGAPRCAARRHGAGVSACWRRASWQRPICAFPYCCARRVSIPAGISVRVERRERTCGGDRRNCPVMSYSRSIISMRAVADGMARKYRVMIIDGVLYPLHLAISADWKVHYFTADMAANAAYREEERRFLTDMQAVLGQRAVAALGAIGESLGLDYAGVDFGLGPDGALLLFEANATMVINPPDPDPIWDYRRAPILAALDAAKRMLLAKARVRSGN